MPSANFELLERTQPPGTSILCFDRRRRVVFVSKEAEKLCAELFGCLPVQAKPLPTALGDLVLRLKNGRLSLSGEGTSDPEVISLNCGAKVRMRLVQDPAKNSHCLLFEREIAFSHPSQLRPLGLSAREAEISFWIYQKKTNWEIGRILEVSPRTVEKHVENIFRKLEVNNREDLVANLRQKCGNRDASVTAG